MHIHTYILLCIYRLLTVYLLTIFPSLVGITLIFSSTFTLYVHFMFQRKKLDTRRATTRHFYFPTTQNFTEASIQTMDRSIEDFEKTRIGGITIGMARAQFGLIRCHTEFVGYRLVKRLDLISRRRYSGQVVSRNCGRRGQQIACFRASLHHSVTLLTLAGNPSAYLV